MIRRTSRPAICPASLVAWRWASSKYAGTVITAWVTVSPRYASASRFSLVRIWAEISCGVQFLPSISWVHDVPISRLIDRMVRSGLEMAWRLASSPTRISPVFEKPTTDGVVRDPSALGITCGSPASSTATTEFVVPRSIPTGRGMDYASWFRFLVCAYRIEIDNVVVNPSPVPAGGRRGRPVPDGPALPPRCTSPRWCRSLPCAMGPIVFLLLLAAAGGLFLVRAFTLWQLVRLGRPVSRLDDLPKRVENETVVVLGQRKLLQRLGPGLMHAFIFWGFIVLLTTIVEAFGEIVFGPRFAIPFIGRTGWLGLLQDALALLVIVGVEMAIFFRKFRRDERFKGSHLEEADFILLMILAVILTLIGLNAVKIARGVAESPAAWSPVSRLVSLIFEPMGPGAQAFFHQLFLWSHVIVILGFLAYIPYSKHIHIVTSSINVFFSRTKPMGKLRKLDIDLESEEEMSLGAATVEDLTWKEILDTYTCTECGRCQAVCPAWNTGKPLSPKLLIMNLRDHVFDEGEEIVWAKREGQQREKVPLNPDVVEDEVVWDCTTCGACMQECPVNIEHVDHIVDMRRNLVMAEARFPQEAGA